MTIGRFALHPRQLRRPHGRPDPARGRALPRHGRAPAASRHDRAHMISNIDGHASAPEVTDAMKKRVVEYWTNIHKDLGHGVSQGLALS
ncbi:catalase-related domain-containing protein [Nonomuraea glycinis]|uniref:catalase-related domain-containing protein n=1 Tax=Nonomuraea glycinis TaxID=2047744 RepID=UPI0033B19D78